jgi:xanthine dehydrogenase accessory factor
VDEVAESIERWRAQGERVVLATVVATRRSAPRPVGARLGVSERGELAGSVSGGCVEPDLAERAREIFASGRAEVVTYGIEDETAWGIGLPCGERSTSCSLPPRARCPKQRRTSALFA